MTYAGSAQRIFMLRRRAESRGQEVMLTAIAVAAVTVTWTLITLRVVIAWLWSEIFGDDHKRGKRELERIEAEARRLEARGRRRARQMQREFLGDHEPAGRLVERTAAVVDELGPAVEAVAAAWQRGKHAASQQAAELAGRSQELVSDSEREQAIEELQHHMVAGRLTVDEFEQRVEIAHSARTRGDLSRACERLPRPRGQSR